MDEFTCVIIEDDLDHIEILKIFLQNFCKEIKIMGSAETISDAKKILNELKPDIIFLDMELDGKSSFRILEEINCLQEAEIIIISSHSEYALKAFEYMAVDFILKPLKPESLMLAVKKAKNNIELKMLSSMKNVEQDSNIVIKQLAIPSVESVEIIQVNQVLYLESDGRYTLFHLKDNSSVIASKNLGEYEKLLGNNHFFRIHHSLLVNMDYAVNIHKKDGNYLQLTSQKYLPISKRRVNSLYRFLNLR